MGVGEDDIHVMLGEQDADPLGIDDVGGELHQGDTLLRRHAGSRLVHEKEPGRIGERHGELDPLQIAVGEDAAQPVRLIGDADPFKERIRAVHLPPGGARSK